MKGVDMAIFQLLSQYSVSGAVRIHEYLNDGSRSPRRVLNPKSVEYVKNMKIKW
jgi:hypothetical protein